MIGTLKKLEAFDGGTAAVVTPPASSTSDKAGRANHEPQDRRLLSVPNDGWIGGPGRPISMSPPYALARR